MKKQVTEDQELAHPGSSQTHLGNPVIKFTSLTYIYTTPGESYEEAGVNAEVRMGAKKH